jgi:hypothetical protein
MSTETGTKKRPRTDDVSGDAVPSRSVQCTAFTRDEIRTILNRRATEIRRLEAKRTEVTRRIRARRRLGAPPNPQDMYDRDRLSTDIRQLMESYTNHGMYER